MAKRETQKQRAERWAKCNAWVDEDGALTISSGLKLHLYGGRGHGMEYLPEHAEPIRALLVETWMRARRAKR